MQSNVPATLDIAPLITVAKQTDLTSLRIAALAVCEIFFEFFSRALIDPVILKSVWESHVPWGTSVPSFVLLSLSVFDLGPMYATDGQTDGHTDRRQTPIIA